MFGIRIRFISTHTRYTIFFTWASPKQMVHTNYSRRENTKFALVYIWVCPFLSRFLSVSLSFSYLFFQLRVVMFAKSWAHHTIDRTHCTASTNQPMEYGKLVIIHFFLFQIISFVYGVLVWIQFNYVIECFGHGIYISVNCT